MENNNNTQIENFEEVDFEEVDFEDLPPPPLLRRTDYDLYDFNRLVQMPVNYMNNKMAIVKKSLLNTYEFVSKLKSDKKNECKIDFILVTFNDTAQIFSTVKLPTLSSTDKSN